jgi:AP-1 complex subunit gamma-1
MLPMSSPDVNPGATETQQMRVVAPVGVSHHFLSCWRIVKLMVFFFQSNIRLRLRISFSVAGRAVQDQVDFGGFPPGLTAGS